MSLSRGMPAYTCFSKYKRLVGGAPLCCVPWALGPCFLVCWLPCPCELRPCERGRRCEPELRPRPAEAPEDAPPLVDLVGLEVVTKSDTCTALMASSGFRDATSQALLWTSAAQVKAFFRSLMSTSHRSCTLCLHLPGVGAHTGALQDVHHSPSAHTNRRCCGSFCPHT